MTKQEIIEMIERAGFEAVEIRETPADAGSRIRIDPIRCMNPSRFFTADKRCRRTR